MTDKKDVSNENLHISPIANSTQDILAHSPQPITGKKSGFPLIRVVIVLVVAILTVVGIGVSITFSALDKEMVERQQWQEENPYKSCESFKGATYTVPVEQKITAPEDYYNQFELTVHNVMYNIPGDETIGYNCIKGTALEVSVTVGEDEDAYGLSMSEFRLQQTGTEFNYYSADMYLENYINSNDLRVISGRVAPGITTRGWIFLSSPDTKTSNEGMTLTFNPYSDRYEFNEIELPTTQPQR